MAEEEHKHSPVLNAKAEKALKRAALEREKAYVEEFTQYIKDQGLGNALALYARAPTGFKNPDMRESILETLRAKQDKHAKKKNKNNMITVKKKTIHNTIAGLNMKPSDASIEKLLKSRVWEKTLNAYKAKNALLKKAVVNYGANYAKSMALVLPKRRLTNGKNYFNAASKKHALEGKKREANQARVDVIALLKAENPNINWAKHIKAKGPAAYANKGKINRVIELARARQRLSANKKTKVSRQANKRTRWTDNFRQMFPNNFNQKNITSRNLASKKASPIVKALIEKRILKRKGVATKDQKLAHISKLLGLEKSCIKITAKCLEKYEPDYRINL
jgi:hypothetical protein